MEDTSTSGCLTETDATVLLTSRFSLAKERHEKFRILGGQVKFENRFFNERVDGLIGIILEIRRNPLDGFL